MPNGTYERIKKFSDTLPLKIIMYKHYYAQGPPAYPDIHILRPDNDILRQHLSCKVFIYFRIPYIRTQIISTGGEIYLDHIEGIYTSIFLMFILVWNICTRASCVYIWLLMRFDIEESN